MADYEYVDKRALYASAAFGGHQGRISAVVRAGDGRLQHVFEGKVSLCLAVYSVWRGWLLFSVCAFNACAYQCCRASRRWKNTACV
jgi:hypothetical protein